MTKDTLAMLTLGQGMVRPVLDRGCAMIEYRAEQSWPVNGLPSWHGLYAVDRGPWLIACNSYGPIEYTTPEHALEGARVCALMARRPAIQEPSASRALPQHGV